MHSTDTTVISKARESRAVDASVRLQERDPVRCRLLPGPVPVQRRVSGELDDLGHRDFLLGPLEDKRPFRAQHPEALCKPGSQHVAPVVSKPPIFPHCPSRFLHGPEPRPARGVVWRVEDDVREGVVGERQVAEVGQHVRVNHGRACARPGVRDPRFPPVVHVQATRVRLVEPEHPASATGVQHRRVFRIITHLSPPSEAEQDVPEDGLQPPLNSSLCYFLCY